MKKLSQRTVLNKKKIINSFYNVDDSLNLLKETSNTKFVETAEFHVNLNINLKLTTNQIRNTITLPHGKGNQPRIAVLVPDNLIEDSYKYGATISGNDDFIDEIKKGNINFDLLITIPEMMPKLAKLGKTLGPKGLMPSPKSGTVTSNLKETLIEFKKGKFEYKMDKTGILHIPFGKSNFEFEQLKENLIFLYSSIKQNRPVGLKGKFIESAFICGTMGPSIKIDLKSLE